MWTLAFHPLDYWIGVGWVVRVLMCMACPSSNRWHSSDSKGEGAGLQEHCCTGALWGSEKILSPCFLCLFLWPLPWSNTTSSSLRSLHVRVQVPEGSKSQFQPPQEDDDLSKSASAAHPWQEQGHNAPKHPFICKQKKTVFRKEWWRSGLGVAGKTGQYQEESNIIPQFLWAVFSSVSLLDSSVVFLDCCMLSVLPHYGCWGQSRVVIASQQG